MVASIISLPTVSFGLDGEELAPGYNRCMESATGTFDMLQCGQDAYLYWEEKLTEAYKSLRARCHTLEGRSLEQCQDYVEKIEKNCQEYREQGMNLLHIFYGEDNQLARLEAQQFNIMATQKQAGDLASLTSPVRK